MAVEFTETGLWQEFRYSERQNERHLSIYDRLREEYHTPFYDMESSEASEDVDPRYSPENFAYTFCSYVVPQLVYGHPRSRMKARHAPIAEAAHDEVRGLEFAVNQWCIDSNYIDVMDQMAPDLLFAFTAALVTEEPNPVVYGGEDDDKMWPHVQRLSPRNFGRDPLALTKEESRYFWHRTAIDKEELIRIAEEADKEDGWNLDAIKSLPDEGQAEKSRPNRNKTDAPDRGEIELIEMWWPGFELEEDNDWGVDASPGEEEGYHGTWFTFAALRGAYSDAPIKTKGREGGTDKDAVAMVRKPRPYFGDRSGPYAIGEVLRVPDSAWGLSPLVAMEGQVREWNAQARATSQAAARYKRLIGVKADDPEFVKQIQSGDFDTILPIKDLGNMRASDAVVPMEYGGVTDQMLRQLAISQERVQRNAGLGEAQTGNAPGDATATAVAVASRDSSIRIERIKEQWRKFNGDIFRKVAFYIACSDNVEILLDQKAAMELGAGPGQAATYQGGSITPADFDSLYIEIDATSIERGTEERVQARTVQGFQMILNSLAAMQALPAREPWEELFDTMGDAFNMPGMGQLAGKFVEAQLGLMMQQMAAPMVQSGVKTQPATAVKTEGEGGRSGNRTPGLQGVSQPTPLPGAQQGQGGVNSAA